MKQETLLTATISKVHEQLFNGEVVSITLPATEGELTILAHHEPLICTLKKGTITIREPNGTRVIEIEGGILETSYSQVTILV
jgi:F-type H+-transporting ATPase subunit epsilon